MRLFVALDLPDTIKNKVASLHDETLPVAFWTNTEQKHITLHFIGEVESDAAIRKALKTVQADSFSLKLKGFGTFSDKGTPFVLWLDVESPDALQVLYQKVGDALKTTGYTANKHPYHPHVTLAYFKSDAPSAKELDHYRAKHNTFETGAIEIREFVLYESELKGDRAIHTMLERFTLAY